VKTQTHILAIIVQQREVLLRGEIARNECAFDEATQHAIPPIADIALRIGEVQCIEFVESFTGDVQSPQIDQRVSPALDPCRRQHETEIHRRSVVLVHLLVVLTITGDRPGVHRRDDPIRHERVESGTLKDRRLRQMRLDDLAQRRGRLLEALHRDLILDLHQNAVEIRPRRPLRGDEDTRGDQTRTREDRRDLPDFGPAQVGSGFGRRGRLPGRRLDVRSLLLLHPLICHWTAFRTPRSSRPRRTPTNQANPSALLLDIGRGICATPDSERVIGKNVHRCPTSRDARRRQPTATGRRGGPASAA